MSKLVGLREYARMRGVSLTAVQHAIKSGRIFTVKDNDGRNRIDVEKANRDWEENTNPSQQRIYSKKEDERLGKQSAPPASPTSSSAYAAARAVREQYNAQVAKIDFEQKVGKLVEADKVRLEAFQAARLTRDILLNIPNKIAHEVSAESDPAKIHIMLTEAISKALEELVAEGKRRMETKEAGG